MSLLDDLQDLQVSEAEPMSPEEEARLNELSPNPCPFCSGTMKVWDDEYLGYCQNCWGEEE